MEVEKRLMKKKMPFSEAWVELRESVKEDDDAPRDQPQQDDRGARGGSGVRGV